MKKDIRAQVYPVNGVLFPVNGESQAIDNMPVFFPAGKSVTKYQAIDFSLILRTDDQRIKYRDLYDHKTDFKPVTIYRPGSFLRLQNRSHNENYGDDVQ